MPVVASVNYTTKRIYLSADTVGVPLDTLAVYREVRSRRVSTEADRNFKAMIVAGGNIAKATGYFTQQYVQLLHGCRIVPYNTAHTLVVIRDTFTDDGISGVGCFDRSTVSAEVDVDIQVAPVELRTVTTGALTTGQAVWLQDLAKIHGLILGTPLVVTPTSRVAGDIAQTIVDSSGTVTVERT